MESGTVCITMPDQRVLDQSCTTIFNYSVVFQYFDHPQVYDSFICEMFNQGITLCFTLD